MIQKKELFDLLFVEESEQIRVIFIEISKMLSLSIKIAKTLDEFIELSTSNNFKFILCNLHIENNFGGLYVSRMYTNLKNANVIDCKLFFYSFKHNPRLELAKLSLVGIAQEKISNFYDFLDKYFSIQYHHYFRTPEFRQSLNLNMVR